MFTELYSFPCMRLLLELDCIIHGSVLQALVQGQKIEDYIQVNPIHVSCHPTMINYIDRFLKPFKKTLQYNSFTWCAQYMYKVKENGHTITILMYTDNVDKNSPTAYTAITDVDLISMSRDAVFVQKLRKDELFEPSLGDLIQQCMDKKFMPLQSVTRDRSYAENILKMVEEGWSVKESSIKTTAESPIDNCSICQKILSGSSNVVTQCGHFYHQWCWQKLLIHSVGSTNNTNTGDFSFPPITMVNEICCPLCRESLTFEEALISS